MYQSRRFGIPPDSFLCVQSQLNAMLCPCLLSHRLSADYTSQAMAKHRKRSKRKRASSSCTIARRVPRLVPFPLPQLRVLRQVLMRLPANLKSGSPRLPTFRLFALRTKLGSSFKSLSLTPRMGQSYTVPWMLHLSKNSRLLRLCPKSGISPTAV